jgi:Carboxypeptidase regulatory-like domain
MKSKHIFAIATIFCFCLFPAFGQFTTAGLGGTVTDNSGAAVPEAAVAIKNTETGFSQQTVTNASGAFLFSRLPVGSYEVRVTKTGFDTYVQSGITLTVNQQATKNIVLTVGQVSE